MRRGRPTNMLRGTAARRYAEGTFAIAREANSYDRWLTDLDTIVSAFTQPMLARYLTDPKPAVAQKETVVRQVLEPRVNKLALNLALLLVRRAHTSSAAALRREFLAMVHEARNVAVAEVTTAVPLEAAQTASLKERLERLTSKTIELNMRVDAAIIGGFVARVGDVLIDGSITSRLAALRQHMLAGQA